MRQWSLCQYSHVIILIHPSIHFYLHQWIYCFIHHSLHPSIHPSIHAFILITINKSIFYPLFSPSTYFFIFSIYLPCPSIQLFIHPFVHLSSIYQCYIQPSIYPFVLSVFQSSIKCFSIILSIHPSFIHLSLTYPSFFFLDCSFSTFSDQSKF